uniref:acylglycerol lipase n=1 Tax=Anolis carolinensis TaxID=28377 RepID=A0A803T0C3_ANOCA
MSERIKVRPGDKEELQQAEMELCLHRIFKRTLTFILSVLIFTFLTMYHLGPSLKIFQIMMWYKRQKRGVKVKYVEHEGYRFCYFSRGQPGLQPSILMLHGFSFNKDVWLNAIKLFPKGLHLVCLDMPGHGETTRLLGESYTAATQAQRIHQFVKCIDMDRKPFHLVGTSTGGMVAGLYAILYPSDVCCLSLLCPAGLRYPKASDLVKYLKKQKRSMQSHNFLKHGVYHSSRTNLQHLKGYLAASRPDKAFYINYFLDLSSAKSKYSLHDNMSKIRAPTQIIWGKDDKVLDPSGADILANAVVNSQVHMLEKCGHFIVLDRPRKSAKLLLQFYHSVCGNVDSKIWT